MNVVIRYVTVCVEDASRFRIGHLFHGVFVGETVLSASRLERVVELVGRARGGRNVLEGWVNGPGSAPYEVQSVGVLVDLTGGKYI